MPKRILIQCATEVKRNAVRREAIDGVEHVIISSMTLPDNIVMNGGLYPAEEIEASFKTLERTLAPVEHPQDANGNFLSANDPVAIHNYYAGAFNENVRRENGRVAVDKVINVAEAMKTDRGKRLLDRVNELETSDDPRPIHTSVGVFLEVEETEGLQTNAAGQEYSWIARNMFFDHDAILLDSVGAAQPGQGVGMAVNSAGDQVEVQNALVTIDTEDGGEMSHSEIREALEAALNEPPLSGGWIVDIVGDRVIFESKEQFFSAQFIIDDRVAKIVDIPLPVTRDVTYQPKTNQTGDAMKDIMLKALADAGISVNADISDDELLAKYNELQAKQNETSDDAPQITDVIEQAVANAMKPHGDRLEALEAKQNAESDAEHNAYAELVGNSDKFPGIDVEAAKGIPADTLKSMAANCGSAHGVPLHVNTPDSGSEFKATEMPE
jgi:hypothetical protein